MNSQINLGPLNPELLFLHEEHRAYHLFHNQINDVALNVCRSDSSFWDFINSNPIPDNVMQYIRVAGFGGIIDCGYRIVDHDLITTLIERWRPETHTFHLPFGEVTVTLQDVQVFWGLPVEGYPVTGDDVKLSTEELQYICYQYFGFIPDESSFKGSKILMTSIMKALKSPLPGDATEEDVIRRAL